MSMTRHEKRKAWQHLGLTAGFLAGRHCFGLTDLHFGYWSNQLAPSIGNLKCAQERYAEFVLEHIPADATRILDVGSGGGGIAQRLQAEGERVVDCVSPCQALNAEAQKVLNGNGSMFDCRYEDLDVTKTYDAVVFCESFQYVNMEQSFQQAAKHLRVGGTLLICDFFRKQVEGKSPIGGGHKLEIFWDTISRHPFTLIDEVDITEYTAPTFDAINEMFQQVLHPIWIETDKALTTTHPMGSRFLKWFLKARIAKAERKYFKGDRTSKSFKNFKSYRLLRFERV